MGDKDKCPRHEPAEPDLLELLAHYPQRISDSFAKTIHEAHIIKPKPKKKKPRH